MSTSGLSDLVSARTQTTANTAAAANSPSVRGESQPQFEASLMREEEADQPEREKDRARPVDASFRANRRLGHEHDRRDHGQGDDRRTGSRTASGSRGASRIGPASTIPTPPPIPRSPEMSAIPPATRSRGNSSRMIPNARGKIAPPRPWITRAPISTGSVVASAATSVPSGDAGKHDDERALLPEHVAERVRRSASPPRRRAGRP